MPEGETKTNPFRVGYALPTRKTEAFMVEPFISHAKQHGIDFIPIDISTPLTTQGPFHCIIHKLYDPQWHLTLQSFSTHHPNATLIDPPSAIHRLHDRISMLQPVSDLNIPCLTIPNQLLVHDHTQPLSDLHFPVMAKPLLADGSATAHSMSLVFNHEGLTRSLDPPMVLQEFVNHGGVMFKVYVAGAHVQCVRRTSLPDVSPETMEKMALETSGVVSFSKISGAAIEGCDNDSSGDKVEMPSSEFVDEVAKGLREALGLHLFNFDMIRDGKGDGYLVVDINYFPGYEKLPGYESLMTHFFLNIKKSQESKTIVDGSMD